MKSLFKISFKITLLLCFLLISHVSFGEDTLAFPGAEGFGKYVTGGRGGRVIEVTTLEDQEGRYNETAKGSLREALSTEGTDPITIVFKVSGIIELDSDLSSDRSNITIAGQTAPGNGICIKDNEVILSGENIIIRYIRFRPGDETGSETNSINIGCLDIENTRQIIIDHCSFSWSTEENMTFYDNDSTTVQYCILSESLHNSYHSKGARGYAAQWGGQYASYHHNLIAHHNSRAPRFNGSYSNDYFAVQDFRNNVIYNIASGSSIYGADNELVSDTNSDGINDAGSFINFCYNYIKLGPDYSGSNSTFVNPSFARHPINFAGYSEWYIADNIIEESEDVTNDNWDGVLLSNLQNGYSDYLDTLEGSGVDISGMPSASEINFEDSIRVNTPHAVDSVSTVSADSAYQLVIANSGCIRPIRDSVDIRVVNDVINGTGSIIDHQSDVGGWPIYKTPPTDSIPADSDHDGMPDYWEYENGLDSTDATDRNGTDLSGTYYTNLEVYLNSDIPYIDPFVEEDTTTSISSTSVVEKLTIYPNPCSDILNFDSSQEIESVQIYSISGSLLINKSLDGATSINVEDLTSGMYIIKGSAQSGKTFCNKINKN